MGRLFEKFCSSIGLTPADTDLAVKEAITRGRDVYGWNKEQHEIFDRQCQHGYEPTLTENGTVEMCIHCGHTRIG